MLDFLLPDLDGLEFLQELRKLNPSTVFPVIMLTGEGNEEVATQAFKYGVQDYLVKGKLKPENLYLTINRVIRQSQLQALLLRNKERQNLIATTALRINQSLNLAEILDTTVEEVRQLLKSDRVLVYQFQPDMSGKVVAESVVPGWLASLNCQIIDTCFQQGAGSESRQGHKRAITDIYQAGLTDCHIKLLEQFQVKANLVVPIILTSSSPHHPLTPSLQLWGLLIAHQCNSVRQWEAEELQLLDELATQISIAIQKSQLYSQLQAELVEHRRSELALLESQNLLQTIIDSSPDLIGVKDLQGYYQLINSSGAKLLNKPVEEIIGQNTSKLFPAEKVAKIREQEGQIVTSGESQTFEHDFYQNDKRRTYLTTKTVYRNPQGEIIGLVDYGKDITYLKQIQEFLNQSNQQLEQRVQERTEELVKINTKLLRTNAELKNFAYIAAHDLREPLRKIKCYTEKLVVSSQQKLDPKAEHYLNYISDGVLRLQAQITDLLSYSNLLQGEVILEETALDKVLQDSLRNLRGVIEENQALITAEPLPIVQADFSQMVQLFTHLLDNALKFRREVSPNIEIKIQQESQQWIIAISDNGIGIKPRYQEKIFEIFQKLHAWGKYHGTGIGLAISKKIVERHGGEIWLESEPNVGTTFYFSLLKTESI